MSPDSLHPPIPLSLSRSLADRVEKLRGKLIRSFLLPLPALSPLSPSPGCSRCEANVTGKRGGKEREKEKERELRGEGKAHYTTNLFAGRKTDPEGLRRAPRPGGYLLRGLGSPMEGQTDRLTRRWTRRDGLFLLSAVISD